MKCPIYSFTEVIGLKLYQKQAGDLFSSTERKKNGDHENAICLNVNFFVEKLKKGNV